MYVVRDYGNRVQIRVAKRREVERAADGLALLVGSRRAAMRVLDESARMEVPLSEFLKIRRG